MHVLGTCALRLMQLKKEAPGLVLKKEDKDAPTTAASKENDPNEDDKNAAIPSALSEDQQNTTDLYRFFSFFGTQRI